MAPRKIELGPTGLAVAANVKRYRRRAGYTMRDLSAALAEQGWPLAASAISQIENRSRRVDVDDLMALSVALDTSPDTLLMPAAQHPSDVVDGGPLGRSTEASHVWYWLLTPPRPGDPLRDWPVSSGHAERQRLMEASPDGPQALVEAAVKLAEKILREKGIRGDD